MTLNDPGRSPAEESGSGRENRMVEEQASVDRGLLGLL